MTVLDANYILRYLLNDNSQMYTEAKAVIEHEPCLVLGEVIAEVVYVLDGYYDIPRREIARTLEIFFRQEGLQMHESLSVVLQALVLYADTSLDYVDCYLCALKRRYRVATFDKKLQKCVDYYRTN